MTPGDDESWNLQVALGLAVCVAALLLAVKRCGVFSKEEDELGAVESIYAAKDSTLPTSQ